MVGFSMEKINKIILAKFQTHMNGFKKESIENKILFTKHKFIFSFYNTCKVISHIKLYKTIILYAI